MPTNKELLQKNKTLREEIKNLKEEIECRVSTWETKEGEYEEEVKNYKDTLDEHLHHYENLKKENEENGSIIEKLDNCIADLRDENKKLLEQKAFAIEIGAARGVENEKLKKDIKEAMDEVKEEYKKYKEQAEAAIDKERKESEKQLKDLNSAWAKKRDENGDSFRRMIKEYKEEIESLTCEVARLKKELYIYKDKPQLGRSYANSRRENKELQEEIQNLKDQNKEDLDDYELFLEAFDVAHATEAIDWYWKHLTDESKDSLIKKGHQVKSSKK